MNMSNRAAWLVAAMALVSTTPVSAQFGGLDALRKKLESAAKELEKPKPQTPPQSSAPTQQGGYAAPYPDRAQAPVNRPERVVTAPAQPTPTSSGIAQNHSAQAVLATEIFRCRGESDGTPRKLELEYLQSRAGVRSGRFTETSTFLGEKGKETQIERGTFRFSGAVYDLSYRNPEMGLIKLQVSSLDSERGWVAKKTKYAWDYPDLDDARTLTEYISPQRAEDAEEAGGDTNGLFCELVKPIFSTESFEDYNVDDPDLFPERYDAEPALPQFAGRDAEFRIVRTMLTEAVKDHWDRPKFGKYHLAVLGGKWGGWYGYLVDMRSGKVSNFFAESINGGMIISYSFRENSNLLLSITADNVKDYCRINYSRFQNGELITFKYDLLGSYQICLNEYGTFPKENYLDEIEQRKFDN